MVGWEHVAHDWLVWARTPGHDAYWDYREAFFELVPPPAGPALEVGCGEGRVSRDLRARGHDVVGLEASPTLLRAAADADQTGRYVAGRAEALPFADASFALVVAYNVLIDVDDMPASVAEMARVLRPGGALCACVPHPMTAAGAMHDGTLRIDRRYLVEEEVDDTFERDGLRMRFEGRRYPLEAYSRALEVAGLAFEALREPAGTDQWRDLPMFLMFRARRC